jgi:hypothetical protein
MFFVWGGCSSLLRLLITSLSSSVEFDLPLETSTDEARFTESIVPKHYHCQYHFSLTTVLNQVEAIHCNNSRPSSACRCGVGVDFTAPRMIRRIWRTMISILTRLVFAVVQ